MGRILIPYGLFLFQRGQHMGLVFLIRLSAKTTQGTGGPTNPDKTNMTLCVSVRSSHVIDSVQPMPRITDLWSNDLV